MRRSGHARCEAGDGRSATDDAFAVARPIPAEGWRSTSAWLLQSIFSPNQNTMSLRALIVDDVSGSHDHRIPGSTPTNAVISSSTEVATT